MDEKINIAGRIQALLAARGDKAKAGKSVGVSKQTIWRYGKGEIPKQWSDLLALSETLGVSPSVILTGHDPPARLAPDELPQPVVHFSSIAEPPPELSRRSDYVAVPLVDGAVAAGGGRVVSEDIMDWAWVHSSQIGNRDRLVAVRVQGDSMSPALPAGSMVVIDLEDRRVVRGAPYVVRVDDLGACGVKYLEESGPDLVLIPENREYREQRIRRDPDGPDIIVGRVVWSTRSWVRPDEAPGEPGATELDPPAGIAEKKARYRSGKRS